MDYLETPFEHYPFEAGDGESFSKRKINNNLILLDMNDVKTLRIGILGFGTVGQGTWKHLIENEKSLGINPWC